MNPYALLPLAGLVANLALGGAILRRAPRALPNRLYALLCLAIAWWSALKIGWRSVDDADTARFLFAASAPGWTLLPSLYLHFVVVFTGASASLRSLARCAHVAGALFGLSAFVPEAMVERMVLEPFGFAHVPGPVYRLFTAYLALTFIGALWLLADARRHMPDAAARAQSVFLFVGILFPLVGGLVTNMILPITGTRVVELGELLSTVNAALVAVAMRRHRLLALRPELATETILSTMGEALLVVDGRGVVVLANPAARRLLGARGGLTGRPVHELVRSPTLQADQAGWSFPGARVEEAELLPPGEPPIPALLSVSPIRDAGGVFAGLVCVARDVREERRVLAELAAVNERLQRLAVTDELTGVSNRRFANERLAQEIERGRRYGRPFSVGLLDLDGFKAVNDHHGHQTGDRVLRDVAIALRGALRGSDVVARWGGDEFMLIFPETDAEAARSLGERLLGEVSRIRLPGSPLAISASLGLVTCAPRARTDAETLVRLADDALYRAKALRTGVAMANVPES